MLVSDQDKPIFWSTLLSAAENTFFVMIFIKKLDDLCQIVFVWHL